jgi:hypothetical protein
VANGFPVRRFCIARNCLLCAGTAGRRKLQVRRESRRRRLNLSIALGSCERRKQAPPLEAARRDPRRASVLLRRDVCFDMPTARVVRLRGDAGAGKSPARHICYQLATVVVVVVVGQKTSEEQHKLELRARLRAVDISRVVIHADWRRRRRCCCWPMESLCKSSDERESGPLWGRSGWDLAERAASVGEAGQHLRPHP